MESPRLGSQASLGPVLHNLIIGALLAGRRGGPWRSKEAAHRARWEKFSRALGVVRVGLAMDFEFDLRTNDFVAEIEQEFF